MKFIITTPIAIIAGKPKVVEAETRLDALLSLSITVWTEKEWQDAQYLAKKVDALHDAEKP